MLHATANSVKKVYHSQLSRISALTSELKSILSDQDFASLMRITDSAKENIFKRTRAQLKDKFEQLRNIKYGNNDANGNSRQETIANELKLVKPAVLNLTQKEIPDKYDELLNLGPKFVPALSKVPFMEIMTSTEIAAQELNKQEKLVEAERLRHDVSGILGKFINKKLPSNLTKDQQIALKDLRNEPELKVVPFDKGVGFVLIHKDEMIRKISNELGDAKVISKDPTNALVRKVQSKISQLHKDNKISKSQFYQMYPSDATPPRMYGMIKAHKPEKNFPMRTVVSTIGTATYGAAKFLVDVFQPTLNKNEIRVMNTTSFVEEAKDWQIDPEEVQCSFDVVALYPSIPIKKAIAAMIELINNDIDDVRERTQLNVQDIKSLLELCLSKCYFLWNDLLYQIDDAGPIGLSLMVVVAEGQF